MLGHQQYLVFYQFCFSSVASNKCIFMGFEHLFKDLSLINKCSLKNWQYTSEIFICFEQSNSSVWTERKFCIETLPNRSMLIETR